MKSHQRDFETRIFDNSRVPVSGRFNVIHFNIQNEYSKREFLRMSIANKMHIDTNHPATYSTVCVFDNSVAKYTPAT